MCVCVYIDICIKIYRESPSPACPTTCGAAWSGANTSIDIDI